MKSTGCRSVVLSAAVIGGMMLISCVGNRPGATATPVSATLSRPTATTIVFTPIPSSASTASPTHFEETFSDNDHGWFTQEPLVTVENGRYIHVLDCPGSNPAPQCGNFVPIPFTFPASFRLSVEATLVRASAGAHVTIGLQVRKSDEGYYYIRYGITDGVYQMSRITQTGEFTIVPETQTDLIAPGFGEPIIFGVIVQGPEFTPLVNAHEMAPIYDGNIRSGGDGYLVVLAERGHTAVVEFDTLVVEKID